MRKKTFRKRVLRPIAAALLAAGAITALAMPVVGTLNANAAGGSSAVSPDKVVRQGRNFSVTLLA